MACLHRAGCTCVILAALLWAVPAGAQDCREEGPWRVTLGAGLGAGAGAAAALAVAGGLTLEESRDFDFAAGALAGVGVTAGLSAIYGVYDGFTGCRMAGDTFAWSVPIVTFVVGALLPVGVWLASDEVGASEAPAALRQPAHAPGITVAF